MGKDMPGQPPQAQPQLANVGAQVVITAFTDGRQPDLRSNVSPAGAMRLLGWAIAEMGKVFQEMPAGPAQADSVDRKWEFMGPRETVKYDKFGRKVK